jgi:hypothetical protein
MTKRRTLRLGILALAVVGAGLGITHIVRAREKVVDLSGQGIAGFDTCPVHHLAFSIERVSAWHGSFGPHATKEWWERVAEARKTYPCAVPFPAQVEDPEIDVVVRSYCQKCRESFNAHVGGQSDEQAEGGGP